MWTRGRSSVGAAALVAGLAAAALSGCGSASVPSPPAGVDGLQIPTPSLEPADFVPRIDNVWLPLAPGNAWVYQVTSPDGEETSTITVLDETREIDGVSATAVHEVVTDADGEMTEERYSWFAQDAAGNVWSLGETTPDRSWEAGAEGAEAGLAMAAVPRLGDGYRTAYQPGRIEDRASVLTLDASVNVPFGSFTDLLEIEHTTPLEPNLAVRTLYAEGVGLLHEETVAGGDEVVALVSFTNN